MSGEEGEKRTCVAWYARLAEARIEVYEEVMMPEDMSKA